MQGASCSGSDLFSSLPSPLAVTMVYAVEIAQAASSQTAAVLFVLEASTYNHKGLIKQHPCALQKIHKILWTTHVVLVKQWLEKAVTANPHLPLCPY